MDMQLSKSSSQFWLYSAGIYLVGAALGFPDTSAVSNPLFWAYFAFFLVPANIFLYGLSAYFQPASTEDKPSPTGLKQLRSWLFISGIMFAMLLYLQTSFYAQIALVLFVVMAAVFHILAAHYKRRIIWDFMFSSYYILPGVIGYIHTSNQLPSWFAVWGFICWTLAMHLYAMIPNIQKDKNAELITSAVWLGVEKALLLCGFLWSVFALVMMSYISWYPWSIFSLTYPLLVLYLFTQPRISILKLDSLFPYINAFLGAMIYILAIFRLT